MKGILLFFITSHLLAMPIPQVWGHKDIKEAKKSATFFKFIGESTKFGFITTSFEGFAKAGELSFKSVGEELKDIKLNLKASQIDTDSRSRNEKMWEKCLRVKEYPEIKVTLSDSIKFNLTEQTIPAMMRVAGTDVPLNIFIKKKNLGFVGESQFKLSEANIPDPSITVAKVHDVFKIYFEVH